MGAGARVTPPQFDLDRPAEHLAEHDMHLQDARGRRRRHQEQWLGHSHLDRRPGKMHGQHLDRALVAVAQTYLHDLSEGIQAEQVIGEWIDFYNGVSCYPISLCG